MTGLLAKVKGFRDQRSRNQGSLGFWVRLGLLLLLLSLVPRLLAGAEIINPAPVTARWVAFTFDDGPNPLYTPKILRLLAAAQGRATFFMLGKHVAKYPHLVQEVAAAGHEIGSHTWSHPRLPTCSLPELAREVEWPDLLLAALGVPTRGLFRPPYSACCPLVAEYLRHTRHRLISWSIDAGDYLGLTGEEIAHRVAAQLHPGAIVVFHDSDEEEAADRRPTIVALELLLPYLKWSGWHLVTVSELLAAAGSNHRLPGLQQLKYAIPEWPPSVRRNP